MKWNKNKPSSSSCDHHHMARCSPRPHSPSPPHAHLIHLHALSTCLRAVARVRRATKHQKWGKIECPSLPVRSRVLPWPRRERKWTVGSFIITDLPYFYPLEWEFYFHHLAFSSAWLYIRFIYAAMWCFLALNGYNGFFRRYLFSTSKSLRMWISAPLLKSRYLIKLEIILRSSISSSIRHMSSFS